MAGRWIAFEGGEASGKSTQAKRLADSIGAVLTREPGGTALGAELRKLLLDAGADRADRIEPRAEALMMAADRSQHVHEIVAPALAAGRDVVSDRSAWSFLAYQGFGRGLGLDDLRHISDWAAAGQWPDLAVLVDVPAGEAAARLIASGRRPDRLEMAGEGFHERVRAGFAALAAGEPHRWAIVEGTGSPEQVEARVKAAWRAFIAR